VKRQMNSWHVGIAAEAFAAGLFARCGLDVSVQYGANQPEYDLIVANKDNMLKISVKGSQDGSWGLTQDYKKDRSYHEAIDVCLSKHCKNTVFCLVQFDKIAIDELPRVYLAAPYEIAEALHKSSNGRGDTILHEHHTWGKTASAFGTVDDIPASWKFSKQRVDQLMMQNTL
jgi:hypothetical protein